MVKSKTSSTPPEVPATPPTLSLEKVGDIAVVTFDAPNNKVNTLHSKLMPEFEALLISIQKDAAYRGVVLISGKDSTFIAGADIEELRTAPDAKTVEQLSRKGQMLFAKLDAFPLPVVAAIHGACLGGGLELALACDYRIATTASCTVLGLPEVMLGLLPGAGGTQRLPRLIGLQAALQLILAGNSIRPEKAYAMGLIDYLTIPDGLKAVAIQAARDLATKKLHPKHKRPKGLIGLLEKYPAGQNFILDKARKMVEKKTYGLYPAPLSIIEVIRTGLQAGEKAGLGKESREFAELSQTAVSNALISLYYGQNDLKKNRYGTPPHKANQLAVLGGGLMGSGIALVSIQKNFHVRLKDLNQESMGSSKKYIWKELEQKVKRRSLTECEANQTFSRFTTQLDFHQFKAVDMVIEAVFEDLTLKHRVLQEVEANTSDTCVFASNTSALPIAKIASVSKRPENVVGMHYFSPVHKMPLLEVIVTEQTSDATAAMAVDVGIRQGKTVIVVKDGPGFYTTRILAPFMDEAALLCQEGMAFDALDRIMQRAGYPVGPITLMDEVGLDVALHVAEDLKAALGERVSSQDPAALHELLANKCLGRKSGKGFYLYEQPTFFKKWILRKKGKSANPLAVQALQKQRRSEAPKDPDEVSGRMTMRMINEAAFCLQEGILSRPLDGDIGAVFGLGFPPIHGGPFRYLDTLGISKAVEQLLRFRDQYGTRFEPAPLLVEMGKIGKKFYP